MTMTLVQTVSVSSATVSSISFTGIPQGATDILILASLRQNAGDVTDQVNIRVNNVASGVYDYTQLYGTGTSRASVTRTNQNIWEIYGNGNNSSANTFGAFSLYIPNYANSSINKTANIEAVSENFGTEAWQTILSGSIKQTTPITSVQLNTRDGTLYFAQGSTASLYTITKA